MHIHTCLSLHECSIEGTHCPCFTYLKQNNTPETTYCKFTLFPVWHPRWLACCLQHRKNWELWNTGSSALNWKCAWKDRLTTHIIFTTGEKRVNKQAKVSLILSNIPQNYSKGSSLPLTQLLQFWFFPGSSSLDAVSSMKPGIGGPGSFWQDTRTGSICLLSSGPSSAGGRPHFTASVFFFFFFPDLILSLAED